ncbi:hypothetical protein [Dactylosporangium salmoneum]|uniref:Uncharacterized protein n=1 Tax=Dactylosporangium salmoneum TaxID=53361 RepID=A0ABN3FT16_9ACTN
MLDLTGTAGEPFRVAYLIVGLLVLGAAFLPGNGPLYRVASLLVGVVMSAFSVWDLLRGANHVTVGAAGLLPALGLLVIGAVGVVRTALARRSASAQLPPPRPHPAARQFGGPASYQPHPPHAYGRPASYQPHPPHAYARPASYQPHPPYAYGRPASYQPHPPHAHGSPVPAAYPAAPGYATVHAAYPAYPATGPASRREIAAQRTATQADPLAAVTPVPPRHRAAEPSA